MNDKVDSNLARTRKYYEVLVSCEGLTKDHQSAQAEAESLANAFADMEDSFRELLESCFPRMLKLGGDSRKIRDTLIDIGEELRHILYHIRDPMYYRYLWDDSEDE